MQTKIITWLASALLLILPVTHITGFRTSLLIITFLIVFWVMKDNPPPKLKGWLIFVSWALLPIILLPFAVDIRFSIKEISREIFLPAMIFFIFYTYTQTENTLRYWLLILAIGIAHIILWVAAAYLLYDYDIERFHGWQWYSGIANLSTYTITLLPLFIPAWFLFTKHHTIIILLFSFLLWLMFFTQQRIVIPVVAVQLGIFLGWLGYFKYKQGVNITYSIIFSAIAIILLLSTLGVYIMYDRFQVLWTANSIETADIRFITIPRIVFDLVIDKPWTGYGFGYMIKIEGTSLNHAHNVIFTYLIYSGIWGGLMIITLFAYLTNHYYRMIRLFEHDRLLASIGIAGIMIVIGVLLRNQVNDMFRRDLALLFWAIMGMLLGFASRRIETYQLNSRITG